MRRGLPGHAVSARVTALLALGIVFLFPLVCPAADDLHETRTNTGLTTTEPYSYLLMEQARSEPGRRHELLRKARHYAPNLPAVYFALAEESFSPSLQGILRSLDYFRQGIIAYGRNFWWDFSIAGMALFALVVSCTVSLLIVALLRLPADIPLIFHEAMENKKRLALLGIPLLLSFFGLTAFVAGALFIVGLCVARENKLVAYAAFLLLLSAPLVSRTLEAFLAAPPALKAVVEVNESKDNRYAAQVLRQRKDFISLFTYALALKRSGSYAEAIEILQQIPADTPVRKSRVSVNLGNAHFGDNNLPAALESYRQALNSVPLPSAYYNLSQIHREMFDFEKGEEYFHQAARLSPEAVSRFSAIASRNPNRFVVDENLPFGDLWTFAMEEGKRPVPALSAVGSVLAVVLIPLFYYVNGNMQHRARRCRRCGEIYCAKCIRTVVVGETCPPCYRSLVKIEELDPRGRVARLLLIHHQRQKRRQIAKVLSFLFPGAGQAYAGRTLIGWIFAWFFLFCLSLLFLNTVGVGVLFPFGHPWITPLAAAGLVAVYAASAYHILRRIQKGWL